MSNSQCAPKSIGDAARQSEVGAAVSRLYQAAELLSQEAEFTNQRVSSVLAPAAPTATAESKDQQSGCALAEQLNTIARQVEAATNYFASTRNRVEL
ncbi:hypothetical protein [Pseudoxanthomonas sp. CF125]|uniref:hypothetical protein n=1 Tax=Pseudoxanthomonas sp. CF125 TaxID=1855303 RepID=UPI0008867BB5|nr:hypothetical protein [Pseudoxanthomonas sp. CF125]SDQ42768.1 hypothetical protein SAMN05216569_1085 [Pseudoxanthomonas sp. CF125]